MILLVGASAHTGLLTLYAMRIVVRILFFPTSERKIPSGRARGCVLQNGFHAANNTSCYLPKCKYVLPARGIFQSRTFRDIRLPLTGQFLSAGTILKIGMNTP
jgi:hypothetical protein